MCFLNISNSFSVTGTCILLQNVQTSNGCTGDATNYIVTVNPAPTITAQPIPNIVCKKNKIYYKNK